MFLASAAGHLTDDFLKCPAIFWPNRSCVRRFGVFASQCPTHLRPSRTYNFDVDKINFCDVEPICFSSILNCFVASVASLVTEIFHFENTLI